MESLWQDIRSGWRSLRRRRASAWIAVAALAIGIGANIAVFSVINGVLLRPLPYPEPDRLALIWGNFLVLGINEMGANPAEYFDYRDQNRSFDELAAFTTNSMNLTGGTPERLPVARLTPNLLTLVGGQVRLGRAFDVADAQPGADDIVLLSFATWAARFGADPDVVGKPVTLDGRTMRVVGVLEEGFEFPHAGFSFSEPADLFLPLVISGDEVAQRSGRHSLRVLGRLRAGTTLDEARADMSEIASRLEREQQGYRGPNGEDGGWRITVVGLQEQVVRKSRPALFVMLGLVGLVLLIACTNVASLQLAHAMERHSEIAVRSALGASRSRLVRQLLTEGLVLATVGGALGLLLAMWCVYLLPMIAPADFPRLADVTIDGRVLVFAAGLSIATAVGFGIVPSIRASRRIEMGVLNVSGATSAPRARRSGEALVVLELALAMFVLVCAGLMTRGFVALERSETGVAADGVLTAELSLPATTYADPQRIAAFAEQLATGVRQLPGVASAGMTTILPLGGTAVDDPFSIEGRPLDMKNPTVGGRQSVTPGFFPTIGVTVLAGRDFTDQDVLGAMPVAIVNERMAQSFFGGDALGQRIKLGAPGAPGDWRTVVGVVGDTPHRGIGSEVQPDWYAPLAQSPSRDLVLVVRSTGEASVLPRALREAVQRIDTGQPITRVRRLDEVISASIAPRRFTTLLALGFGAVAMALAVIGVYGVMQGSVTRRERELGIRLALGAKPADVRGMVLRRGLTLAVIGIGAGLVLVLAAGRLVPAIVGDANVWDPATLAAAALALGVVALIACLVPAIRASVIDPIETLRRE